jgi:type I restriction enzyme S subunit
MTMAADKQDKVLNFSSEREQSGACSSSAERENNQGKNFLNVPNKRVQSQACLNSAERVGLRTKGNVPTLRFPEFKDDWNDYRLRDLCTFHSGGTPSIDNVEYWEGEIPFVSSVAMHNTHIEKTPLTLTEKGLRNGSKLLEAGNLLLLVRGSMLWNKIPICYNDVDVAFNQDVKGIVPNSKTTSLFLLNWIQSHENRIKYMVTGTGIGAGKLDSEDLLALNIKLPSLNEQKKIEKFLSLIDERIETQIRIIEDLKQLRSAIRNRIFKKIQQEPEQIVQIKEILTYEQPTKYLVSNTEYVNDSSLIPVLTANKAFILGYTFEKQGVYDKGDCIILDDFTLDCKIVDFPFKVKSSAIKILRAKNRNMLRYAFEYLKYLNLETSEHKRHYIAEIEPIDISLPSQEKIEDIIHLFESLDMRIVNAEKNWSSYLSQKQFLLQTLFI